MLVDDDTDVVVVVVVVGVVVVEDYNSGHHRHHHHHHYDRDNDCPPLSLPSHPSQPKPPKWVDHTLPSLQHRHIPIRDGVPRRTCVAMVFPRKNVKNA